MIRPSSAIEKWWFQVREILDLGFSRTCSCYSKNLQVRDLPGEVRESREKREKEEKRGKREEREGEKKKKAGSGQWELLSSRPGFILLAVLFF